MKIVFLDIDGVLNCASTQEQFNDVVGIEPRKVALVARIIQRTGARVVLSSSWRIDQDWRTALHLAGMDISNIIDTTGRNLHDRSAEITEWIARHSDVDTYVILDDELIHPTDNLLQTIHEDGLTEDIAERAIQKLNVST